MSSALKQTRVSPEDYLALERAATRKSEYHDGQIYAMSGASRPHNLIVGNLGRELGIQLRHRPCELYLVDMRVRVTPTGSYNYPDAVVVCGEPELMDDHFDTLLNPTVIFEVLSPSTEAFDRGGKFDAYRRLESLRAYVLVSQDRVLVESYSRQGDEWQFTEWSRLEDTLSLASIGCEVALREIYAKVTFPQGGPIAEA